MSCLSSFIVDKAIKKNQNCFHSDLSHRKLKSRLKKIVLCREISANSFFCRSFNTAQALAHLFWIFKKITSPS